MNLTDITDNTDIITRMLEKSMRKNHLRRYGSFIWFYSFILISNVH